MSKKENFRFEIMQQKQKSYKQNNNQYKSIDSLSKRYLNKQLNSKSEYEIPLSSLSNYNFSSQSGIFSKINDPINESKFQIDNTIKSKNLNINYLKNRLNHFHKANNDLNNEYRYIANKSKILIDNINNNNALYSEVKKEYENSMKNNIELKQKFKILLQQYQEEIKKNNRQNEDKNEIYKLKKEQKILLSTLKSKEDIISNLQNTLNLLKNEIEEEKNEDINNININKQKIKELKIILNDLNNKINDNKNNISILNDKKHQLKVKKNFLLKNMEDMKTINYKEINESNNKNEYNFKSITENNSIIHNKIKMLNQNLIDNNNNTYNNNKIINDKNELNDGNDNEGNNNQLEHSFGPQDYKGNLIEKLNSNSEIFEDNNCLNNNNDNIQVKDLNILQGNENESILNHIHKKNQSLELDENNNKIILNYAQNIEPIKDDYTISHTLDEDDIRNQKIKNIKNKNFNKFKNPNKNITNQFQNSSYLFTITKGGTFIEFDILEKVYTIIDTSKINDWDSFIKEYLNNYDGSLLLNTFQGLFILTGKKYSDLYYFSKKYNSISILKSFKFNHKYGALMLSSDNDTLLIMGGETKNIETLNFEDSLINKIPPLLTQRINSSYSFIGNILIAFFGKNNNTIEFIDINVNKKWELLDYKINIDNENDSVISDIYKSINLEGHAAIPVNEDEILIIGGNKNNKMMIFNFSEKNIEIADIDIPLIDNVGEYRFDKDKYFNSFIGNDKSEIDGNSINQLIGMDIMGNIHYFDNNFDYSVVLFNNQNP